MNKKTDDEHEYVYILSNPSYRENLLKIGFTKEHPLIRAEDLQTSGVPEPFIVEGIIITSNGNLLEKKIHNHLEKNRLNKNREFFEISKPELVKKLENDLKLELTPIDNMNPSINIKKSSPIRKMQDQLKKLEEKYQLVFGQIKKKNSNKFLELTSEELLELNAYNKEKKLCNAESYLDLSGFNYKDRERIETDYYFITGDIIYYNEMLNKVNNKDKVNKIKDEIGTKQFYNDNRRLKKEIQETDGKLDIISDLIQTNINQKE